MPLMICIYVDITFMESAIMFACGPASLSPLQDILFNQDLAELGYTSLNLQCTYKGTNLFIRVSLSPAPN